MPTTVRWIYLRGSHLRGLQAHHNNGSKYFVKEITNYDDYNSPDEVLVSATAGDLLAHHALTIHRTEANRWARPRTALIADFIARLSAGPNSNNRAASGQMWQCFLERHKELPTVLNSRMSRQRQWIARTSFITDLSAR